MAETAISARNLSKLYRLGTKEGGYKTVRDTLSSMFKRGRRVAAEEAELWALRQVSFEVERGSVLGLIGKNGAGKSTLLKILSRITEPTSGTARIRGSLASLLEVGTGFHPELTGRENVYLNGAILGMRREEVRRKFDQIVAFAEIERFLDTPVKRYSSGMYVRLAFAVAAHLEPDILFVDEVLAVGDAAFQTKCFGRLREITQQHRTIVLVSHNMNAVTRLCTNAIWLDGGSVRETGPVNEIVARYLAMGATSQLAWIPEIRVNPLFNFERVELLRGDTGIAEESVPADVPLDLLFLFRTEPEAGPGKIAFRVTGGDGRTVFASSSTDHGPASRGPWQPGRHRLRARIPAHLLIPGQYFVSVSEPLGGGDYIHENILSFWINEQNSLAARDYREGVIAPLLDWAEEPES